VSTWKRKKTPTTGLERVAEELMGRRKWKQYQDSLAQSSDLLDKQSPSIGELRLKLKSFVKKKVLFDKNNKNRIAELLKFKLFKNQNCVKENQIEPQSFT
jgi:hypothetical protein